VTNGALIAITGDFQKVGDQERYTSDRVPIDTMARTLQAVPVIVPPIGNRLDIERLLDRVEGVFIPGGLSNVHPAQYGRPATKEDEPFDRARDATTLPLIQSALRRGIPLLMTCRGFQELNVLFGGTLRSEPTDRPEEEKHGTPESADSEDERYRLRHHLNIRSGGMLSQIIGSDEAVVNSLHSQLVDGLAPGLCVEATADDGTIEAVSVPGSKGFALGVVFHPEYWAERDEVSKAILTAFGAAVSAYANRNSFPVAAE
jgi:putative glutamine amidotransferase